VPEQLARLESRIREVRNRLEEGVRAAREGAGTGEGIGDGIGEGIGDDIGDGTPRPRAGAWSWASERNFDYVDFENHFRGSVEEITERQRRYVAEFVGATGPVVDLGCGRGEFLGLLAEAGVAAYGVDRHPDMVTTTRAKGFEVVEADAFEHLASVEPGSLGGIFCAQMVEHLAPAEVPTFFELANRALAVGAPVIVETINPESLFVFAHAFYVDLGHLRPLHPLTLEFLAQAAGFGSVRVDYVSPIPPEFRPQPLPPVEDEPLAAVVAGLDENFRRIDDLLFAPQDFAVVARR
jgi:O-antigen chain-terminating methyltransferase